MRPWTFTLLLLVSCERAGAPERVAHGLDAVPADTPYVMATLEPFDLARVELDRTGKLLDLRADETRDLPPGLTRALLDELRGKLNAAGLAELGLGPKVRYALYGVGVYPVFRLELADPGKFTAAMERVFRAAGMTPAKKKLSGQSYVEWRDQEYALALAVIDKEVVATIQPIAELEKALPIAFGHKPPAKSMASSKALEQVVEDYGYPAWAVGYVDTGRVAAAFPKVPSTCRGDLQALASSAPRVVIGYPEWTQERVTGELVLETTPGLREELAALRHAMPAPPAGDARPLASVTLAVDLGRALALARKKSAALRESAGDCAPLRFLSAAIDVETDNLPAWLPSLQGAQVIVDGGRLKLLTGGFELDGHALVHTSDPQAAGAAIAAELGAPGLVLPDGGKPVALPDPPLPNLHLARKGNAIALSAGQTPPTALAPLLDAPPAGGDVFLSITYDYGRLMNELLGGMGAAMARQGGMASLQGLLASYGEVGYTLAPHPKGVAARFFMEFK